jgi:hypothetical protein
MILIAACGGGASSMMSAPTSTTLTDTVSGITNMNPTPGTALQAGHTVTFSGTAAYILASADFGSVRMIVQDQNDRQLPSNDALQIVVAVRGSADATLTQTVTVPDVGVTSVRVVFMLAPAGASSTTAMLNVSYPVH